MEPTREKNATLVDVLDRALNKGLLINADLIISVADIPLIGVNLKAAIAGMETMLEYGMMKDWDEALRAIAREERARIAKKEKIITSLSEKNEHSTISLLRSK
ncbi:MAG: gas vesicle protein [Candidatus Diapherotrites archaeon]